MDLDLSSHKLEDLSFDCQKLLFQKYMKRFTQNSSNCPLKTEQEKKPMVILTEVVFFGKKEDCELVIENKHACKFYLHKVILNMKAPAFLENYILGSLLNYSCEACVVFFSLLYGIKKINNQTILEVLAMVIFFKMQNFRETLESELRLYMDNDELTFLEVANAFFDLGLDIKDYVLRFQRLPFCLKDVHKLDRRFVVLLLKSVLCLGWDLICLHTYDVRDNNGTWFRARLIEKTHNFHKFHFFRWENAHDETIPNAILSSRVFPAGTRKLLKTMNTSATEQRFYLE